ncbi:MAG: site-specific integrase, partial [Pseudomonadota bacterium]
FRRLDLTFELRQAQERPKRKAVRLWAWSRVRGWQIVKEIMDAADIADGPHRRATGCDTPMASTRSARECP